MSDKNVAPQKNPQDEYSERKEKLIRLREVGIDPYPARAERTHMSAAVLENFETLEKKEESVTVAGRLRSKRTHGNLTFADLEDESGKIQLALSKKVLDDDYKTFVKLIDTSDFVQVTGTVFVTKVGVQTVQVNTWTLLTKALRNVPAEHFGLQDGEERFRKRYLDILLNDETRDIVRKRAKFWSAARRFHEQHDFLEVETPTLEITTGGGDANPFATHHDSLDVDVYLRISAGELWQKRLMVAGLEKTFEIGRIFRNEGMSAEHLQDYTQCEAYWAYADCEKMYTFLKECYQFMAQEAFGTQKFTIGDFDVDLSGEWPLIDYTEEIERQTGVNIWDASEEDMIKKLEEFSVSYEAGNRARLIDTLWKHCRKNIGGPAILINEPKITSPLAKTASDNENVTERFHFIIAGSEVGQGYSELNDPLDQRERFEQQQALRDGGDDEAQMADWEFVEALEYGMPPTAGHGFSERLFAFLMDKPVRDTQIFPLMKPKE